MSKGSTGVLTAVTAAGWLLLATSVPAEIYKTVDQDGNVVYTDQPPGEAAEPVKLPGMSVIETVRPAPRAAGQADAEEQQEVTDIRELRHGYKDFALTYPAAEETIWGTEGRVQVAWDTRYRLQPGMHVVLHVDGVPREPTTEPAIDLRLERGEHTVFGELIDARHRKIARTEPRTFYVQQYSINYGANRNQGN